MPKLNLAWNEERSGKQRRWVALCGDQGKIWVERDNDGKWITSVTGLDGRHVEIVPGRFRRKNDAARAAIRTLRSLQASQVPLAAKRDAEPSGIISSDIIIEPHHDPKHHFWQGPTWLLGVAGVAFGKFASLESFLDIADWTRWILYQIEQCETSVWTKLFSLIGHTPSKHAYPLPSGEFLPISC